MAQATARPPRRILFDMDGVLCRYDRARRLKALCDLSGILQEDIEARLWDSGFEDAADAGHYATGDAYLEAFAARLGYPMSRQEWIETRRIAMIPQPRMLGLVRRLAGLVEIALLSNNGPLMGETFAEIFPEAARLFGSRAMFSFAFATKKPDPAIYRMALDRLGGRPEETVFVDDKPHNVDGARSAGLTGITFTTVDRFQADLSRLGLAVPAPEA